MENLINKMRCLSCAAVTRGKQRDCGTRRLCREANVKPLNLIGRGKKQRLQCSVTAPLVIRSKAGRNSSTEVAGEDLFQHWGGLCCSSWNLKAWLTALGVDQTEGRCSRHPHPEARSASLASQSPRGFIFPTPFLFPRFPAIHRRAVRHKPSPVAAPAPCGVKLGCGFGLECCFWSGTQLQEDAAEKPAIS